MARPLDLSALTRAERLVFAAGALAFANGFAPWWFRVSTPRGSYSYDAGLTGWSLVPVLAGAAGALLVLARAWRWPHAGPRWDGAAQIVLAAAGTSSLALATNGHAWIGLWIGLVLAIAQAAGGVMRARERRRGWT